MNQNSIISLPANAALTAYTNVKLLATGKVDLAGATDKVIGVVLQDCDPATGRNIADIHLINGTGIMYQTVGNATAIAVGDEVEQVAGGTIGKYTTGTKVGVALQACSASGAGSIIRVLPY
jgi:hypothetical protein